MCTVNRVGTNPEVLLKSQYAGTRDYAQNAGPAQAASGVSCKACGTLHYQHQLACRKCGAYFLQAEPMKRGLCVRSIAAGAISIIGVAAMFMVFGI